MNRALVVIGVVLFLAAAGWTLAPHDLHESVLGVFGHHHEGESHSEHDEHGRHQAIGAVIAVIGLGLMVAGWKVF